MSMPYDVLRRLFVGQDISQEEARQVTYNDLILFARVVTLKNADPTLTDEQLSHCYSMLLEGSEIRCTSQGIDIFSSDNQKQEHLSDRFDHASDVKDIEISLTSYLITNVPVKSSSRSFFDISSWDGGGSSNNNNNNNNNNNA